MDVDPRSADLIGAGPDEAADLACPLAHLRRRSLLLDLAVILASLGGVLTGLAVLTLFVGALRDGSAASVLFVCFRLALGCMIGAILAFLVEILLAGRGVRITAGSGWQRVG